MGRVIEQPISEITEAGYAAVEDWCKNQDILKFYVWVGFMFLKTHLKDRKLRAHLDARKGIAPIANALAYDWERLHYLHTLVRCFTTGAHIHINALGSFFVIKVQEDASLEGFDYGDLYARAVDDATHG